MQNERSPQKEIALTIPFRTIMVVLITLLAIHLLTAIAPLFFPVFFGILLAVALTPAVQWLEHKKMPRGLAIGLVTFGLWLLIVAILWLIVPPLYQQLSSFVHNLPQLRQKFLESLPKEVPIRQYVERHYNDEKMTSQLANFQQILFAGNMILGGFAEIGIIFVFTVYLLIDGPSAIIWLSAFFTPTTQKKIESTRLEVGKIISSYILGQVITSAASFVFVLVTMSLLGIPSALLVASLAFVLDILPVLGFFLTAIPAMLFAATVSMQMPFILVALFFFYHGLENYVIVPWVYGNRLRVSSLVVFFTLLAAGLVAGVEGAIAILPIIASYPIIERVWLRRYLSPNAVNVHAELEA